jgi:hypothetical protein
VGVEGLLDSLARMDASTDPAARRLVQAAARLDYLESVVLISPAADSGSQQQLRRMAAAFIAVSSAMNESS